jgi:hypothetical protein
MQIIFVMHSGHIAISPLASKVDSTESERTVISEALLRTVAETVEKAENPVSFARNDFILSALTF